MNAAPCNGGCPVTTTTHVCLCLQIKEQVHDLHIVLPGKAVSAVLPRFLALTSAPSSRKKAQLLDEPATNAACIRVAYKPPPTSILSLRATKSCLVSQLRPRNAAARDSRVALVGDEYLARSLTDRPFSLTLSNIQVHAAKWGLVGSNRNSTRS